MYVMSVTYVKYTTKLIIVATTECLNTEQEKVRHRGIGAESRARAL